MASRKSRKQFPLFVSKTGQWRKDIWSPQFKKSIPYYFGSAVDDPDGSKALADWLKRESAIRAGIDRLGVNPVTAALTVSQLVGLFMIAKRAAVASHDRSPATLGDYVRELAWFRSVVGEHAEVSALKPLHFSEVNKRLIQGDGKRGQQGRHSRARIIRYIRALFNWGHKNGHCSLPSFGTDFCPPATGKDAMRQMAARSGKVWNGDRIATGAEIDALLAKAHPLMRAAILLGLNLGLGWADLGRLRWNHLNLETGEFSMPRGKTGVPRKGWLWHKTRKALERVATLRHNRKAMENDGEMALVLLTRTGLPIYREAVVGESVLVVSALASLYTRVCKRAAVKGLRFYRLRHTLKTLGKRARDRDALNLMMGHREGTIGEAYDHEDISLKRVRRVARKVHLRLWPAPKLTTTAIPALPDGSNGTS